MNKVYNTAPKSNGISGFVFTFVSFKVFHNDFDINCI